MHVTWLRQQVQEVAAEFRQKQRDDAAPRDTPVVLPAFSLPSSVGSLVAVHLQGLMTGSPELREQVGQSIWESVAFLASGSKLGSKVEPQS